MLWEGRIHFKGTALDSNCLSVCLSFVQPSSSSPPSLHQIWYDYDLPCTTSSFSITRHMGLELQNSFKEVTIGDQYGKLTVRHHVFRNYVTPNQTRPVFGLFGLQSWLTSRHVCGHVARTTCILRAPVDSPWVVDDVRHWNFSSCS